MEFWFPQNMRFIFVSFHGNQTEGMRKIIARIKKGGCLGSNRKQYQEEGNRGARERDLISAAVRRFFQLDSPENTCLGVGTNHRLLFWLLRTTPPFHSFCSLSFTTTQCFEFVSSQNAEFWLEPKGSNIRMPFNRHWACNHRPSGLLGPWPNLSKNFKLARPKLRSNFSLIKFPKLLLLYFWQYII